MRGTTQKLKLLYLKEIFEEETDNEHAISMPTIVEELNKRGVPAERKSVYDDIRLLQDEYGLSIAHEDGGRTYRLEEHDFEFSELKLIIDAVSSCKTLSEKKSLQLIDKLKNLCSKHERATLHRQIIVTDRAKTQNPQVHFNINTLNMAISQQRTVLFKYFYYDVNKRKKYSYGGRSYFMYPYALIYVDNNYYLLAFDTHGRRRHFRVDRMEEVRIHTWGFSRERYDAKVDLEHYTKYTFSMYGKGDIVRVTMRFDNNLVSMVLDRFGHDIMLVKDGDSHFTVTEPIAVSPQFFAWIFGLGDKAEIVGPVEVRDQMRKMMEKMMRRYKPEK